MVEIASIVFAGSALFFIAFWIGHANGYRRGYLQCFEDTKPNDSELTEYRRLSAEVIQFCDAVNEMRASERIH